MNAREQLVAYLATLGALVVVLLGSMTIASLTGEVIIGKMEAFGIGTVTGGLIGLMRLPSSRPAGTPNDPISTEEAK
ncbi:MULTISPECIES: hypothetical protein [unclassified Sphingomonas]|uniref:hypothetical protein n=1 Tax=unclassified Sphingomonas TaxID=196159 RepID=UPI0006F8C928|nr:MULTISPECIES: hypothetical protein [unclassified Sphingomonas]KQM58800.1 hypothetical protein ASE65_10575 [Sphingomonas sp. Leaf16]KQN11055.1 hypothetical protein ASE81_11560 [Sphingomonas sp. Leaf29]KQN18356.1 hypothetical protein ASE83_11495 [Sphingomonas sp. Leaf32]